ncbi:MULTISPECIES: DUF6682 family protein [unclassified Bradyrhizobium]|uniref:phage adaptor protein n=1 Tax=unclassified Bradyrhizobium TaxID=2631580 RepID=UPI0029166EF1|nr:MULTISPECIES: DUF6682 family protein [unclassified Bradyrhizobium]
MTITAKQVMALAGRLLQDEEAVRWTLPELADWINEAVKAIVLAKPSANSVTAVLSLTAGTYQELPDQYQTLLRIVRNISSEGPPRVGGRVVRVTTRDALDAQAPYWHDPRQTPYKAEVRQFVFDEESPRSFYVYPGNDGTGKIEAIVAELPAQIAATGDPAALASYDQDIGLEDIYLSPVLDFVLFRAMSKDSDAGNPIGAVAHYQAFASAVGIKTQVEGANSPNARAGVAGT